MKFMLIFLMLKHLLSHFLLISFTKLYSHQFSFWLALHCSAQDPWVLRRNAKATTKSFYRWTKPLYTLHLSFNYSLPSLCHSFITMHLILNRRPKVSLKVYFNIPLTLPSCSYKWSSSYFLSFCFFLQHFLHISFMIFCRALFYIPPLEALL